MQGDSLIECFPGLCWAPQSRDDGGGGQGGGKAGDGGREDGGGDRGRGWCRDTDREIDRGRAQDRDRQTLAMVLMQKNLSNLKGSDFRKQNIQCTMVIVNVSPCLLEFVSLFMTLSYAPSQGTKLLFWLVGWWISWLAGLVFGEENKRWFILKPF